MVRPAAWATHSHAPDIPLCLYCRGATGWFYFLHYNGWNKKYDEWVEEGGLVKAEEAEALGAAVSNAAKALLTTRGAQALVQVELHPMSCRLPSISRLVLR